MNVEAASGAVEGEILELALEVGLHLQELEPEHLGVDGDRVIASTSSLRLVDELVGLRGLLGDGVDGVLEDVAFAAAIAWMLGRPDDGRQPAARQVVDWSRLGIGKTVSAGVAQPNGSRAENLPRIDG
jgi:hypothetical protein